MFALLRLSNDPCIRLKYYQLATKSLVPSEDVDISNMRTLVIDEGVSINTTYHQFVAKYGLIDVVSAPLLSDSAKALEELRRVSSAQLENLDLSGNSILVDTVDYNGLWTTAFEDAIVEKSPFYSAAGEQIGAVDLMKIKTRARISHFPTLNLKGLELPVGKDGRYRMMFGIVLDNSTETPVNLITGGVVIEEFVKSLSGEYETVEIAIPRFNLTFEYDAKMVLENIGLKDLWSDPLTTEPISEPEALPSGFVHRTTIILDQPGAKPSEFKSQLFNNTLTETDSKSEKTYIANKPFLMALVDSETLAVLMAGGFTEPTYPKLKDVKP